MLRRNARLRREYIYKKSIEARDQAVAEKRQRLKLALEENRPIPTELRKDALDMRKALDWSDPGAEGLAESLEDDEYKWAGVRDPKIVITTSRDPSSKLKQFAKEMRLLFPNAQRINRGKYEVGAIVEACRANEVTDIIVLHEHRGVPDGLVVSHLPFGPTAFFTLANVVTRHDILNNQSDFPSQQSGDGVADSTRDAEEWMKIPKTISEAYPHVIVDGFTSRLGRRVADILRYLFPVPREESRRVVTFANRNDTIAFRQHTYVSSKGKSKRDEPELTEIGPRLDMRLYKVAQGTLEQTDSADLEFVLRPYMNTARKRKFLSTDDSQSSGTVKVK